MTPQSCLGCKHYRGSLTYEFACYRSKLLISGRALTPPPKVGFPTGPDFENHPSPTIYEGRADGDHCGPNRIHFTAGEGVL